MKKRSLWHFWAIGGMVLALTVTLLITWSGPASAADAAAGQSVYKQRCAMCHGNAGAGDGVMGKLLKPPPPSFADARRMAGRSDEALTKIIAEGKNRMPGYAGQLTTGQIQEVLAYIRTLAAK